MVAATGHGRRKTKASRHLRRSSLDSNAQTNAIFFETAAPVYNASQTWKSEQAKEREQFERKKNLVKHIAPEQFRNPAKPTNEACDIVPITYGAWVKHKSDIKSAEIKEMTRNIKIKQELMKADSDARLPIKSAFGKDGKRLPDYNLSTVLAQLTVFTPNYLPTQFRPEALWPSHAELHWDGDNRENNHAKTRCGRFLPDLRDPRDPNLSYAQRPRITQLPLDQTMITSSLCGNGPKPVVFYEANMVLDNDPLFESAGQFYIGSVLMEEIGEWKEPFMPDWLAEQKAQKFAPRVAVYPAQQMPMFPVHPMSQPVGYAWYESRWETQ